MTIIVPGIFAALISSIVLVTVFKHKVTLWEACLPFVLGVTLAFLCKFLVTYNQTRDTEFHGGHFVKAEYYEGWTEEYEVDVDDYCDRTVPDGNGGTKSERYKCGSHKEKRTRYHPPYWETTDSNGNVIAIDSDKFERESRHHGNKKFHNIYHSGQVSFGDGNMYVVVWDGSEGTYEPVTVAKTYENRVQASGSVFKFEEVDADERKEHALVDYPPVYDFYHQDAVVGPDFPGMSDANRILNRWNAKIGREKQVRMFLVVYAGKSVEAAMLQEQLWKGGNKNEFVVCVGVDSSRDVKWAYVFSWSEADRLKFVVRDFAMRLHPFDPVKLVEFMVPEVRKQFVRKPFAEFNYLTVEPPFWGQVTSFLVAVLAQVGLGFYLVKNDITDRSDPLLRNHRFRAIRCRLQRKRT